MDWSKSILSLAAVLALGQAADAQAFIDRAADIYKRGSMGSNYLEISEQLVQDGWRPGAVNVLSVRDGRVCAISGYVDPALVERFFLADR